MINIEIEQPDAVTITTALVHYALHVADTTYIVRCLEKIWPEPSKPWSEIITDARTDYRKALDKADAAAFEVTS